MNNTDRLKRRLKLLSQLEACESLDISALYMRLGVLKEIAFTLLDEVEALENLRPIDIKHGINLYEEVQRFEVDLIVRALERTGGNQTRAAQLLGLNLTTLHSKLKRHNISPHTIANSAADHDRLHDNAHSSFRTSIDATAAEDEQTNRVHTESLLAVVGGS